MYFVQLKRVIWSLASWLTEEWSLDTFCFTYNNSLRKCILSHLANGRCQVNTDQKENATPWPSETQNQIITSFHKKLRKKGRWNVVKINSFDALKKKLESEPLVFSSWHKGQWNELFQPEQNGRNDGNITWNFWIKISLNGVILLRTLINYVCCSDQQCE